jgi:predicted transcriptional regulator
MLNNLITSKTRLRLLVKFFLNAATEGYLRGLADELDENTNAIRKELNHLSDAGFIVRLENGNKITYQANQKHPFFDILQQLMRKYVGLDDIIEHIVGKAGHVERVYLIGDYAKGIDSGTIEVLVQGEALDIDYLSQLATKVSAVIQKQVLLTTEWNVKNEGVLVYDFSTSPTIP